MKIQLENIKFSYEDEEILNDFNLTIESGTTVAIIGHNGSGKSTLAKVIMGLLEISSGNIYIDDVLLSADNVDDIRKNMSIIFQNPDNQFVGVTVKDDIAFGLENRCIERNEMLNRIDKYANLVGMSNYLNRNPEELSGGQKQRVAIAGALAMETDLLIFDESTSMLDPRGTKEINNMIKEIKNKSNKTIIIITHDLEEAVYADRVIVLNGGNIVLDGNPKEVFKMEEVLKDSSLKSLESIELIKELKNVSYENKKEIEEALWELTFKM